MLRLAGPGNNGGDGFVAARRLADWGIPSIAVLVATEERPRAPDAARNWKRLEGLAGHPGSIHAPVAQNLAIPGRGIEKAGIVVDALLGTGVRGQLREPVREAVDVIRRARDAGVPVLAVDTPTAVDLTSGDASDPVVRADLTVTFHRPKTGLRARVGKAYAGRVLVAPIGDPARGRPWLRLARSASARSCSWPPRSSSPCSSRRALRPCCRDGQAVVFHHALLIIVLIAGTALVLWRILRSPGTGPDA